MSYNLNGVWFRLYTTGLILFVSSFILIIFNIVRFNKQNKKMRRRNNKYYFKLVALTLFLLFTVFNFTYELIYPKFEIKEGIFVREYRNSSVSPPLPVTYAYVFDTGENYDRIVYLDNFTKKDILGNKAFIIGKKYRITYTSYGNIIVGIESLN